jgi:hypothetical protein
MVGMVLLASLLDEGDDYGSDRCDAGNDDWDDIHN